MGTLGRIASGISNDLITRAADVILKERRKLICVVRDTPYNLIHIRNMETVTLAGGIICPATPSFYSKPKTIEEVAATVVDRVLDLAGFDIATFRWGNKNILNIITGFYLSPIYFLIVLSIKPNSFISPTCQLPSEGPDGNSIEHVSFLSVTDHEEVSMMYFFKGCLIMLVLEH